MPEEKEKTYTEKMITDIQLLKKSYAELGLGGADTFLGVLWVQDQSAQIRHAQVMAELIEIRKLLNGPALTGPSKPKIIH